MFNLLIPRRFRSRGFANALGVRRKGPGTGSLALYRFARCGVSAGVAVVAIFGATHLRHVNHTTVALGLVLLSLGIAVRWGWVEALTASLAGGLGFDYFFLPPRGFGLEAPEHMITLGAFLLTAVTTGGLAARVRRHRNEAEHRSAELGSLYEFSSALRDDEPGDIPGGRVADHVVGIFGFEGAAFFDRQSERVFRSGIEGGRVPEVWLREVAATGVSLLDRASNVSVIAIREGSNLAGSLGIAGAPISQRLLDEVAERVSVTIAKGHAARQSMEAELLRRSENLRAAVLDALAHEIKSPLSTVKVSVSTLLSQRPGSPDQQRELLQIINEEADRMRQWIDDAVRMSSYEAGAIRLRKTPNQVKDVIASVISSLGALLAGRPLEVQIDESLPLAILDAELIEKVIWQLLDNAIKYSPPGSPIRVSAEFTGAEIVVSVADSGCGIPKPDQERIFEKYYRGGAASSRVSGTGLGLPSAKYIMEAHGGEIWVTSVPGSGSVFRISLPAAVEALPRTV